MRIAVKLPDQGWVELAGFARLSPARQAKELQEIRRIGLKFELAREGEPFSIKPSQM